MTPTGVALLFTATGTASGSLLDVRDPRGFVAAAIQRSGVRCSPEQRDDLIAEGLAILCDLARKYEPHRAGYAKAGKFSGYAASLLPRRMQDEWHRMNPTVTSRDETGKRVREFLPPARSLHDEGLPEFVATHGLVDQREPYDVIDRALMRVPAEYALDGDHRNVVACTEEGLGTDEIAVRLRLNRQHVSDIQAAVASAIYVIQQEEAAA